MSTASKVITLLVTVWVSTECRALADTTTPLPPGEALIQTVQLVACGYHRVRGHTQDRYILCIDEIKGGQREDL